MKTASIALKAHLAGEVTTVCTCWRITRRDGAVFRFTDHDVDLLVDGETYVAAVGYTRTAIAANADMSVDNMDVNGIFDDASITETDLRSGLFDGAEVRVFLVNWANPAQGTMALRRGRLGDVLVTPSGVFQSQLMGFGHPGVQPSGQRDHRGFGHQHRLAQAAGAARQPIDRHHGAVRHPSDGWHPC